jgi:hypothetical protein
MATGRIGVTPTLGVRWSKAPASGTTSLSGLDDSSVSLVYSVGYEQVYRNGVLLSRGNDYTATTGTTVVLTEATIAGDLIEIFAQQLVPLTDAISKGQFTAKGTLLSATAASTPGVLAVGSNGQYLSADSTASTGLAWATVSAGSNWSLLNAGGTALTGAQTVTVSGISGKDKILILIDNASSANTTANINVRLNTDTGGNYTSYGFSVSATTSYAVDNLSDSNLAGATYIPVGRMPNIASSQVSGAVVLSGCNASGVKTFISTGSGRGVFGQQFQTAYCVQGFYSGSSTISSISVVSDSGNLDAGTVYVYTSA